MANSSRQDYESRAPLRGNSGNRQNGYGSVNNEEERGTESLLSCSRIQSSFAPDKSSAYIISSAIVGLIVSGAVLVIVVLGFSRLVGGSGPQNGRHGFDPMLGFERYPSVESLQSHLRYITRKPHIAGKGEELAEWTLKRFRSYGLDAKMVTYYPYLNYPEHRRVAIDKPAELKFEARLVENSVSEDPTSQDPELGIPTFHGYSGSGNVTSEVVYANYGRWEDFELLRDKGILVEGKIALVRYGKVFRGLKVQAAEQHGAIGVLIYSDPLDDGASLGSVYPEGPYRPGSGVQRGSVQYLSVAPGDPLTPGYPATVDAPRIDPRMAKNLPQIPSLPLSSDDAYPILRALAGEGQKARRLGSDWAGGMNISYWTGPSEAKVNLVNIMDGGIHPIYNVIVTIPGQEEIDQEIILGNHRDAWSYGAVDPGSGTSAFLEVGRTFGLLLKKGWRPRRTIKLCSWDAEEYGLVGSTEYVEEFSKELTKKAIAYINVDMFEGSEFSAQGSPLMYRLLTQLTKNVTDPTRPNATLYDNWLTNSKKDTKDHPTLSGLGSGSDYTPFYQHLGIPSLNLEFTKKAGSGIYHSNYDSYHYMTKFGDPYFKTHRAMAELWGKIAIKLADSAILPFDIQNYASELSTIANQIDKDLPAFKASKKKGVTFKKVIKSVSQLQEDTTTFTYKIDQLVRKLKFDPKSLKWMCPNSKAKCDEELNNINDKLAKFEKFLVNSEGIPSRPWFKHIVYAPGLRTGYSSETFSAFREAVSAKAYSQANQIAKGYADLIKMAASSLN